jgi:small conductance mechanosensitive channel
MPIAFKLPVNLPAGEKLLDMTVRIAFTVVVVFGVQRLLFLVVSRFERLVKRSGARDGVRSESRARTLGQVFRSLITALGVTAVIIESLAVLGWDVRPLLAGAGLVGVALGFGAQSLVRDWISGIFILLENQFAVGDLIEVGGVAATVEEITVRSTTLRDGNGFVHFVPNGEMRIVINRSRGWNRAHADVPFHAGEDAERVLEICREVVAAVNHDPEWSARMLEPAQVLGIESMAGGEARVRIEARTLPGADAANLAREIRRRALHAFHDAGIRHAVLVTSRDAAMAGSSSRTEP